MVVISHGDKGGAGKSFQIRSYIDHCLRHSLPISTVDCDNRTSDIFFLVEKHPIIGPLTKRMNLRDEAGWAELADHIEECHSKGINVAISFPAAIGDQEDKFGRFLYQVMNSLGIPYRVVWMLNDKLDGVALLKRFIENSSSPIENIQPVLNTFFGNNFSEWESTKTRALFAEHGVKDILFPKMDFEEVLTGGQLRGLWSDYLTGEIDGKKPKLYMRMRLAEWLNQMDRLYESMNLTMHKGKSKDLHPALAEIKKLLPSKSA